MNRALSCLALVLLLTTPAFAQSAPSELKPWQQNAIDFETGMLWKVGGDTTFNYRIVPFMITWRTKEIFGMHFRNGSALTIRHKFTGMLNWFAEGSENRYLGFAAGPTLEWWDATGTWSIFGSGGGGVGWVDAQGAPGGQGQDFTLNWYGQFGVSRALTDSWALRVSGLFQHLSNGGQTTPNPGLNSLGLLIGLTRSY